MRVYVKSNYNLEFLQKKFEENYVRSCCDKFKRIFILVDRNTSIMGCCTFGGKTGPVTYELDLRDCSDENNPRSLQKLNSTYNRNDCVDGIIQLKFAKGIPVKKNVKYALACRTSATLATYGQKGLVTVNGPDGTKFDFSTINYFHFNSNRTTTAMGQLPQILYGTETGNQIQVSFKYCELTQS